jgi:hypothetical protein
VLLSFRRAFISIVRLLLWAEGEAHQSLSVDQMLYLTVGYDWLLFGFVTHLLMWHFSLAFGSLLI